jgi:hypothetical protein
MHLQNKTMFINKEGVVRQMINSGHSPVTLHVSINYMECCLHRKPKILNVDLGIPTKNTGI